MLTLEALEGYLIASDWKPADGMADTGGKLCSRCAREEATVSICISCFLEVAAEVAAGRPVELDLPNEGPNVPKWLVTALLSLCMLVSGGLLGTALH